MFQPNVLAANNPDDRSTRKRALKRWIAKNSTIVTNSTALAEREGGTATSLGRLKGVFLKRRACKKIHRVPSIEGDTATSLGNRILPIGHKQINRKNAPNELSLGCSSKTAQGE